jgi:Outer membrane protein beta-barrel domain
MRNTTCGAVIVLLLGGAATSWAQSSPGQAQPAPAPSTPTTQGQITMSSDADNAPSENEWAVSGFVGPSFGSALEETETGFGGSVAYLFKRTIGAEAVVAATPGIGTTEDVIEDSGIDSYMANIIAAVPLGRNGAVQPFVSGGLGAMRLRALVPQTGTGSVEIDDTRFGANVGAGLMWFKDRWGVRTDIRYYDALRDDEFDADDAVQLPASEGSVLTDGSFWRYNLGVAYRW